MDSSLLESFSADAMAASRTSRLKEFSLAGKTPSLEEAQKTAKEFEAMVIGQMLQPMFSGLKSEAPFGGGHAESTWRSMLVDEYGKMIAENGGLGIAKQVTAAMLQAQEA